MLVSQGQDLQSKVGASGNTTGAHLHWGVRDGQGQPQDPTAALGPMGNLPPVPGTEQMGPPGGTPGPAGGPLPGAPPAPPPPQGAGHSGWTPRAGAGQADPSSMPGGGGNSSSPDYQAGYQAGMQASKNPGTPPIFVPAMQQPIPSSADASQGGGGDGGMGGGQDSADTRWDLYESKDTQGFWGPAGQPKIGAGGEGGMGAGGSYTVDLEGGGQMTVNASSPQAAQDNVKAQGGTPAGSSGGGGGSAPAASGGGGAASGNTAAMAKQLQAVGWQGDPNDAAAVNAAYKQTATPADYAAMTGGGGTPSTPTGGGSLQLTPSQAATIDYQNRSLAAQQQQFQQSLQTQIQAENDRHNETMAQLQQNAAFHQDDVTLQQQVNAETQRHNQASEQLQAQQTQMQQTLEQMREANSVQLQQMQEGNQIYLQQGQQAFQDWQTQQADRMQILSSALNNPWLQQLSGMTPGPGGPGAPTGGADISNLMNQVLQPYNAQAWGAQNAPSAAGLGTQAQAGGPTAGAAGGSQPTLAGQTSTTPAGGTPGGGSPSWSQWQGWSPFQMAAYRTDIEAQGPGAWNAQQANLENQFAGQGGSPNITQMQAASATPEQSAGQQMTANIFGQTTPNWQAQQQKQWSQAQAPQVKQNLTGIAA
jgi:hypothetical protein